MCECFAPSQHESIHACADDTQNFHRLLERDRRKIPTVAAHTKIFAIGAVQVALTGDIIDCRLWIQVAVISGELEQVAQIDERSRCKVLPDQYLIFKSSRASIKQFPLLLCKCHCYIK